MTQTERDQKGVERDSVEGDRGRPRGRPRSTKNVEPDSAVCTGDGNVPSGRKRKIDSYMDRWGEVGVTRKWITGRFWGNGNGQLAGRRLGERIMSNCGCFDNFRTTKWILAILWRAMGSKLCNCGFFRVGKKKIEIMPEERPLWWKNE